MSDLEKVIELYTELGIPPNVTQEEDGRYVIIMKVADKKFEDNVTYSNKFVGYLNCYTDLIFDKDGKFVAQGIWQELAQD